MQSTDTTPLASDAATPATPGGSLRWFWESTVSRLRTAGQLVLTGADSAASSATPAAPCFVVGDALFARATREWPRRRITWLIDDPANTRTLSEDHLASLERVYSPLLPDELVLPTTLGATAHGVFLRKTRFLPAPPESAPPAPPAFFSLTHLLVPGPFPVVAWLATLDHSPVSAAESARLLSALATQGAPGAYWLLPPPLDQLDTERLEWLAPEGTSIVSCLNLRSGVLEILRRRSVDSSRRAPPRPQLRTEDLAPGVSVRLFSLPRPLVEQRLGLPSSPPADRPKQSGPVPAVDFAAALADWTAGRTLIGPLATAFVHSGRWRDPSGVSDFRTRLLAESPETPAAFVANAFARLPLRELFDTPSERTRHVATWGNALLDPAALPSRSVASETMRRLVLGFLGKTSDFAKPAQSGTTLGELHLTLTSITIAWLTLLDWAPPALPTLPTSASTLPGELLLGAAAALITKHRWEDALALITLAHSSHPDLLQRDGNSGRWNRFLLWGLLCRAWGEPAEGAAVIARAEAIDFTFADQEFLLQRPLPTRPAGLSPLPRFSLPWD